MCSRGSFAIFVERFVAGEELGGRARDYNRRLVPRKATTINQRLFLVPLGIGSASRTRAKLQLKTLNNHRQCMWWAWLPLQPLQQLRQLGA
jgi:hypothetical protein